MIYSMSSKFAATSAIFLTASLLIPEEAAAKCYTSDGVEGSNVVFWVNDNGERIPLHKRNRSNFRIKANDLKGERNFRFVGQIRDYKFDMPAAIKIVVWSNEAEKSTEIVHIDYVVDGYRRHTTLPLRQYQKHHRDGTKRDNTWLKSNFHHAYRNPNGRSERTDDSRQKRNKFRFTNVPNVYSGGFLAFLGSLNPLAPTSALAGQNKYTYLRVFIRDLKQNPCFTFPVSLPAKFDWVDFQVKPIPNHVDLNNFGRHNWRLNKSED